MTTLATGADERYGWWLLNMLGSVKANSDVFERIVAYDLGLTPEQRRLLDAVRGVEVRTVPPFMPRWREGRAWKAWIWTHVEGEEIVWLDAGLTVLRPLTELVDAVRRDGYFVVEQGTAVEATIPRDYYERFGFEHGLGGRIAIAAGILGFARDGEFYKRVIVPTYESCLAGDSIGWSEGEAHVFNRGLDATDAPIIRNCPKFRHEQTILNLHFFREFDEPIIHDLDRFAGWRSRRDHPEQVIWSHRRNGDFAYMTRIPYRGRMAFAGRWFGLRFRLRSWRVRHSWAFDPSAYVRRLRGVATRPHR